MIFHVVKNVGTSFICFVTNQAFDRQMDGQTERQMDRQTDLQLHCD